MNPNDVVLLAGLSKVFLTLGVIGLVLLGVIALYAYSINDELEKLNQTAKEIAAKNAAAPVLK